MSKLIIPKSRAAIHRDLDSVPGSISVWLPSHRRSGERPASLGATINPSARGQIESGWLLGASRLSVNQLASTIKLIASADELGWSAAHACV